jgi:hypothetical protein
MAEQRQDNPTPSEDTAGLSIQEFRNSQNVVLAVAAAFGLSLLMIIVIVINLVLLFTSSSHNPIMPGIIGGMSVVPIFGITAGVYFLKRPRKITINPQGLVITGTMSQKQITWQEIADVEIKEVESIADNWIKTFSGQSAVQKKRIVLRDGSQRQIGVIDGNIERFDSLAAMIVSYSSQIQNKPVYDSGLQKNRTMASRKKKMRLNLGVGIFLCLMAIASIVVFSVDYRDKQALEKQGKSADATIKRIYMYNVTPRLEYTFTTADGESYSKDVMVKKEFYGQWKEGQIIPVRYVPANPDNSRLLRGNVEEMDIPFPIMIAGEVIILAIAIGCVCMYFLKIVDIKHENGKWIIVRLNDPELSIAALTSSPAAVMQPQNVQVQTVPAAVPVVSLPVQSQQYTTVLQGKQKLPGGLKAIGILNIIFGLLGILWNGFQVISVLIIILSSKTVPSQPEVLPDWDWILYGPGFSLLCACILCISGIGILQFANWGRILAVMAATGKLILGLYQMIDIIFTPLKMSESEQEYIIIASKMFACFIVFLTLIYPLIVLILLNRRSTRQSFQGNKDIQKNTI